MFTICRSIDSSAPTGQRMGSLDGIQLAAGLVWRVQDGFTHLLGGWAQVNLSSSHCEFLPLMGFTSLHVEFPTGQSNVLHGGSGSKHKSSNRQEVEAAGLHWNLSQHHFHCILLVKAVTGPLGFSGRGQRPHLSMGKCQRLWPSLTCHICHSA